MTLGLIGHAHHHDFPQPIDGRALVDGLIDTIEALVGTDAPEFHASVASVLIRILETRLLSDPALVSLSENGTTGHALTSRIKARVESLTGRPLPSSSAVYLADRLETLSPRYQRADYGQHFRAIVRRDLADRGCTEFRCRTCGYWFQRSDLVKSGDEGDTQVRQAELFDLGLTLAPALHADRENDPFKPIRGGRDPITVVTIDHVVPRMAGGPDDLDNLRVVCMHCNYGKMIYRMPLEPVSTAIAASLSVLSHSPPRQIAVVSALLSANGRCTLPGCASTTDTSELTVVLDPFDGPRWGAPWNLRVRCYACAQEAMIAMRQYLTEKEARAGRRG